MMHGFRFRTILAATLLSLSVAIAPATAGDRRPLTPDDLFRMEEVGEVALGPDGTEAAVVIRGAVAPGRGHGRPLLLGGDRSHVFLVPTGGGDPRPIDDGADDGAGFWRPLWSPDGRRLAMLSNRGGDNVRLYVWDRDTGKVRRLTDDGIDLWAAVDPPTRAPFAWLDDRRLLCALVASGQAHTAFTLDFPMRPRAVDGWAKAAQGREPTASVLDAGPNRPGPESPRGRLALVDSDLSAVVTLVEGNCIEALASPDHRQVAVVVEAGRYQPREQKPLPPFGDRNPSRLALASLSGPPMVRWVEGTRAQDEDPTRSDDLGRRRVARRRAWQAGPGGRTCRYPVPGRHRRDRPASRRRRLPRVRHGTGW